MLPSFARLDSREPALSLPKGRLSPRGLDLNGRGRPFLHCSWRSQSFLKVDRRFARLGYGFEGIARAFFRNDPLLFVGDNFEQQLFVVGAGKKIRQLLIVFFVFERRAGFRMIFLIGPAANHAIELDVWSVKFWLTRLQNRVEARNQSGNLVAIKVAVVIVQIVEVGLLVVFRFVIAALDSPNVGPMRG